MLKKQILSTRQTCPLYRVSGFVFWKRGTFPLIARDSRRYLNKSYSLRLGNLPGHNDLVKRAKISERILYEFPPAFDLRDSIASVVVRYPDLSFLRRHAALDQRVVVIAVLREVDIDQFVLQLQHSAQSRVQRSIDQRALLRLYHLIVASLEFVTRKDVSHVQRRDDVVRLFTVLLRLRTL